MGGLNKGYVLQDNFKKSCEKQDIFFYRFKDSPTSYNKTENTSFTVSNICDCMLFEEGYLILVELKSNKTKSKSFSKHDLKQLNSINSILQNKDGCFRERVVGGFLIEFREIEKAYFFETKNLLNYFLNNSTKTLNIHKYLKNNICIEIPRHILRKNFRYDVKYLIEKIKERDG